MAVFWVTDMEAMPSVQKPRMHAVCSLKRAKGCSAQLAANASMSAEGRDER